MSQFEGFLLPVFARLVLDSFCLLYSEWWTVVFLCFLLDSFHQKTTLYKVFRLQFQLICLWNLLLLIKHTVLHCLATDKTPVPRKDLQKDLKTLVRSRFHPLTLSKTEPFHKGQIYAGLEKLQLVVSCWELKELTEVACPHWHTTWTTRRVPWISLAPGHLAFLQPHFLQLCLSVKRIRRFSSVSLLLYIPCTYTLCY